MRNRIISLDHAIVFLNYFRLCSVTAILLEDFPCRDKRRHILSPIGLDLFLGRDCNDIASSEGTFTVMFDKTTSFQNRKQMDVLIRYCDESDGLIVTQYLMPFIFGPGMP